MPSLAQQVFISFAHADVKKADMIAMHLASRGVPVWIDHTNLEPGSPDWEQEIRDGMNASFAVVYVASPEARQSRFVKGELALAAAKRIKVYPVWISGADWHDCAPLELLHTQYVDLRGGEKWDGGLAQMTEAIQNESSRGMPDVFEVRPLWVQRKGGTAYSHLWKRVQTPSDYLQVDLSQLGKARFEGSMNVGFFGRPQTFKTIGDLLDEIYLRYLSDRFEPFTYGSAWVLCASAAYIPTVLVPVEAVTDAGMAITPELQAWRNSTLADARLRPRSTWHVIEPQNIRPLIIASREADWIAHLESLGPKAMYGLLRRGAAAVVEASMIPSDMPYKAVADVRSQYGFLDKYMKRDSTQLLALVQQEDSWLDAG